MKVLTIHGIREKNKWFRVIETCEAFAQNNIEIIPFDYGYLRLWDFSIPRMRERVLKNFLNFYVDSVKATERSSVICHSFGTFILLKALKKHFELKFDKVILFGSIWNPQTDLSEFFKRDQIKELLHEVGRQDKVVKWSTLILGSDAGNSGQEGFRYIPDRYRHSIFENKYESFEHNDATFRLHIEKQWMPFLTKERFTYKKDILRDEVFDWIYLFEQSGIVPVEEVFFHARIDSNGNYYGRYIFHGINKSQSSSVTIPIWISADSADDIKKISFSAYNGSMSKITHEVLGDVHHRKRINLHLHDSVQTGERFSYRYKFKFFETMRYSGDFDHYIIAGANRVNVQVNSYYKLVSAKFLAIQNRMVIAEFNAEVVPEKDGSYTYRMGFDNSHQQYHGLVFYYEGCHEVSPRQQRGFTIEKRMNNGTSVLIRKATQDDVKRIYALEASIEEDNAACEAVLLERLRMFNDGFLIVEEKGEIIGYLESLIWNNRNFSCFDDICDFPIHHTIHGDTLYVIFLAVRTDRRRQGIATKMLELIGEVARYYGIGRICLVSKNELQSVYEKAGFRKIKHLTYFLDTDTRPSVLMEKNI